MAHKSTMRPLAFYVGQFLNILGTISFVVGISSDSWMLMSPGGSEIPESMKGSVVSRYGPFVACNYGGTCDHPWLLLAGVDRVSVEIVQALLILAAILYLLGLVVMMLQTTLPKPFLKHWKTLKNQIVVELTLPCAAVTGFTAMLLMGEVKRKVIGQGHQSEHVGPGFVVTLVAIGVTVAGTLCMILNRYAVDESRMARYIIKLKRFQRALRLTRRTVHVSRSTVPHATLSDVNVFVTDGSCSDPESNMVIVPSTSDETTGERETCYSRSGPRSIHTESCGKPAVTGDKSNTKGFGQRETEQTVVANIQKSRDSTTRDGKDTWTRERNSQDFANRPTAWSEWGDRDNFNLRNDHEDIQSGNSQTRDNTAAAAVARHEPSAQESHIDLSAVWAVSVPTEGSRSTSRGRAGAWHPHDAHALASPAARQSRPPSSTIHHQRPAVMLQEPPNSPSTAISDGQESEPTQNPRQNTTDVQVLGLAWNDAT